MSSEPTAPVAGASIGAAARRSVTPKRALAGFVGGFLSVVVFSSGGIALYAAAGA